jgi:alcohol dehydrogenase class IV
MNFEFATATRILFGPGTFEQTAETARTLGNKALLVTGRNPDRAARLRDQLTRQTLAFANFQVATEPTTDLVREGATTAREAGCDFVIGIGGGSVLDGAKAIAALMTNPGDPLEYLEVVGQGKPLRSAPAPWIAIPTTAGTGSEVTKNAVIQEPNHRVKVSLRSPLLFARLAIIDPELTLDLPPALTASTGLDALTQLIEPYVCARANPMTDAFCVEGIRRCARSLRRCFDSGTDLEARTDMALASLFGGLALANSGLGAVHGFAAPLGGAFTAPHGAVCAALLPHVMTLNLKALRERDPNNAALDRFRQIAVLLTGNPQADAGEGIQWVESLTRHLEIPSLQNYGIGPGDFPDLIQKSARASSMKANPISLTSGELEEILRRAL